MLLEEHGNIPLGTLKLWKLELMNIMEVYLFYILMFFNVCLMQSRMKSIEYDYMRLVICSTWFEYVILLQGQVVSYKFNGKTYNARLELIQ